MKIGHRNTHIATHIARLSPGSRAPWLRVVVPSLKQWRFV